MPPRVLFKRKLAHERNGCAWRGSNGTNRMSGYTYRTACKMLLPTSSAHAPCPSTYPARLQSLRLAECRTEGSSVWKGRCSWVFHRRQGPPVSPSLPELRNHGKHFRGQNELIRSPLLRRSERASHGRPLAPPPFLTSAKTRPNAFSRAQTAFGDTCVNLQSQGAMIYCSEHEILGMYH
jgi:hypothetical protein